MLHRLGAFLASQQPYSLASDCRAGGMAVNRLGNPEPPGILIAYLIALVTGGRRRKSYRATLNVSVFFGWARGKTADQREASQSSCETSLRPCDELALVTCVTHQHDAHKTIVREAAALLPRARPTNQNSSRKDEPGRLRQLHEGERFDGAQVGIRLRRPAPKRCGRSTAATP